MDWIAWSLLLMSSGLAAGTHLLRPAKKPSLARKVLTICSLVLAAGAALVASIGAHLGLNGNIPTVLVVIASVIFALASGSAYTELVFHLAANHQANKANQVTSASAESPLRGGLWIGLLERAAIVSTLWASWPEGMAIVLAIKGLGRFSELKNHKAAEQFILGTFASALCACAAYGLGLLLGN